MSTSSALNNKSSSGTTRQIPPSIATAKIAVIDDEDLNVQTICLRLERIGFHNLRGISEPGLAISILEQFQPDVVLMDLVMPELSGPELLSMMRQHPTLCEVPVITLTASRDRATRLKIIELGVSDFLSKPVDEAELSTRLRNVIEAKRYREHLSQSAEQLELAVRQRTRQLEASRRDVVLCLARAAEYRDDNTGRHVIRVGRYSAILAEQMGLPAVFVDMIEFAAQLHDVGKIGIPDVVLHKPGRLTDEEMNTMRQHADIGWSIIAPMAEAPSDSCSDGDENSSSEAQSPMLVMAARITRSHHERWDGKGYPSGLAGLDIPLESRITAVADVFDALSTARCYKPAFPLNRCFEIIAEERGKQFDPVIVDAFQAARPIITAAFRDLSDTGSSS